MTLLVSDHSWVLNSDFVFGNEIVYIHCERAISFYVIESKREEKKFSEAIIMLRARFERVCVCVGEWFSCCYIVEIAHCGSEKSPFAFFTGFWEINFHFSFLKWILSNIFHKHSVLTNDQKRWKIFLFSQILPTSPPDDAPANPKNFCTSEPLSKSLSHFKLAWIYSLCFTYRL